MKLTIKVIVGRLDDEIFFAQKLTTDHDFIQPYPLDPKHSEAIGHKLIHHVMYIDDVGWAFHIFRLSPDRKELIVGKIEADQCLNVALPGLSFTIEKHTIDLSTNKSKWINEWHGSDENQTRNFRHPMSGLKWILKIMRKHREDKWIFIMYSVSGGASSPVRIGELTGRETPVETVQRKAEETLNWILWHQ